MTIRYPAGFRFAEWRWDQRVIDHGAHANQQCELCGTTGLRYHFEIEHDEEPSMQVGSECILKFDIAVYDDQSRRVIGEREQRRQFGRAIARRRRQDAVEIIRQLQRLSPGPAVEAALYTLLKGKALSPIAASTVLWLLKARRIPHRPSVIPVRLRQSDMAKLPRMEDWRLLYLLSALTDEQYRRVDAYSYTCVTQRSSQA